MTRKNSLPYIIFLYEICMRQAGRQARIRAPISARFNGHEKFQCALYAGESGICFEIELHKDSLIE